MKNELTITNKDVGKAVPALQGQAQREDIPGLLQYRLAYLVEKLNPIARAFHKGKNRVLRDHALRDDDGEFVWARGPDGEPVEGSYQIDADRQEEYDLAIEELEAQEHAISWVPLPVKQLENKKGSIPNGGAMVIDGLRPFLDLSAYAEELEAME